MSRHHAANLVAQDMCVVLCVVLANTTKELNGHDGAHGVIQS